MDYKRVVTSGQKWTEDLGEKMIRGNIKATIPETGIGVCFGPSYCGTAVGKRCIGTPKTGKLHDSPEGEVKAITTEGMDERDRTK